MLALTALLLFSVPGDALALAIEERLLTAKAVAMAKHNSGAPVEDKQRERKVIHHAVRLAVQSNVDPEVALNVFTAQIEASKTAQRAFLTKWKGMPTFARAPDLAKEVRPLLDALTPRILAEIKKRRYRTRGELVPKRLDPIYRKAWAIAVKPLL